MANLVITSTANSILVSMNDYFVKGITQGKKGVWRKENISLKLRLNCILVSIQNEEDWLVSDVENLNNRILQIDSIDGNSPSSLSNLYDKLAALLA